MDDLETIVIPISKLKITFLLLGCLMFIIIGISFVLFPEKYISIRVKSTTIIFLAGCLGIVFFGYIGLLMLRKVFDKTSGLVISSDGITENSSGLPAGFVPWSDIVGVKETVVAKQKYITVVVKNPQEYIDRQKSAFKRKLMQKNYDIYGTAVGISANSLKINYSELKKILEKRVSDLHTKRN